MAGYGPPKYDVSFKAIYNGRVKTQAAKNTPTAMYSSDWFDFGYRYLRNNRYIQRKLRTLATRAMFKLKREIPLGDPKDGHMRNELAVVFYRRGARRRDRNVFKVEYLGAKKEGWNAAVRRSTFASSADYKNAMRGVRGPLPSWLEKAAK